MAKNEEKLRALLVVGATALHKPLRTHGFTVRAVRALGQLLRPRDEEASDVRAIVLGPACDADEVRDLLPRIRDRWPLVDVVVWRPRASARAVRDALTAGAKDVLLMQSVERAAAEIEDVVSAQVLLPHAERRGSGKGPVNFHGMLTRSHTMRTLFETVRQVAATDATVLILGETGTGKELLARALHNESKRAGRFVALNCGAVSETLIDSELFGYVKGAFTGAATSREGLFRHADHGTLMLDEIGNIPLAAQYRLLRVLQEGAVRPVGGQTEVNVDARVIAATSNALEEDVRRGRFREDLYYRLDVIRLDVPPLRDRPEDIVYLFGQFARQAAEQYNVERPDLGGDFLDALVSFPWPGNVRQLENITERVVLTKAGNKVTAAHLNRMLGQRKAPARNRVVVAEELPTGRRLGDTPDSAVDTTRTLEENLKPRMEAIERAYLEACLRENEGRVIDSARMAGISRRTMLRKSKQYGLDKDSYRAGAAGSRR